MKIYTCFKTLLFNSSGLRPQLNFTFLEEIIYHNSFAISSECQSLASIKSILLLFLFLFSFSACSNKVELKTKLEISAETPKWSQLYVDIYDLSQDIQSIKIQIQNNKNEINQKFLLIEDSSYAEKVSFYKSKYFQQLTDFNKIIDKSKRLHDKYVKDRTLYNYWLNTVQNDVISEEKAIEEYKIFEKKYTSLHKEYEQLKKELLLFIRKGNDASEELTNIIPDLVGLKFKIKK